MRTLLLLALLTPGCIAAQVDVEEICSEQSFVIAAPADVPARYEAHTTLDLPNLGDSETLLSAAELSFGAGELDTLQRLDAKLVIDGREQPLSSMALTEEERAKGKIDLTRRIDPAVRTAMRDGATISYAFEGKLTARGLHGHARTCVSSSARIERRAF